jgi:hypothetical protein
MVNIDPRIPPIQAARMTIKIKIDRFIPGPLISVVNETVEKVNLSFPKINPLGRRTPPIFLRDEDSTCQGILSGI